MKTLRSRVANSSQEHTGNHGQKQLKFGQIISNHDIIPPVYNISYHTFPIYTCKMKLVLGNMGLKDKFTRVDVIAQWVKPLFTTMPASHVGTPVQVRTALLAIQFPSNAPGKAMKKIS